MSLTEEIAALLAARPEPLSVPRIEHELDAQALRADGANFMPVNSFDVRDAVAALLDAGKAEHAPGRRVQLRR